MRQLGCKRLQWTCLHMSTHRQGCLPAQGTNISYGEKKVWVHDCEPQLSHKWATPITPTLAGAVLSSNPLQHTTPLVRLAALGAILLVRGAQGVNARVCAWTEWMCSRNGMAAECMCLRIMGEGTGRGQGGGDTGGGRNRSRDQGREGGDGGVPVLGTWDSPRVLGGCHPRSNRRAIRWV